MREYQDLNDYELMYMVSENNQDAKDMIFEKYKPLIIKIACNYYKIGKNLGLEIDDFIQEGYFGLFQAISNFSDDKNCLFYTYAVRSINSKMHNLCVRNNTNKSRLLNNSISLYKSINNEDDSVLMDLLEDKNALNPWNEADNYDLYTLLKDYIYGKSISESSILELKYNGFEVNSIAVLLNRSRNSVTKIINKIKKEFMNDLHQIKKI